MTNNPKVIDFIHWALKHVKPQTIPSGAELALPVDECGVEPWQYLFGSVRVKTDNATLDRYFQNHYKDQMSWERYIDITGNWDRNGYATDCEGLCDAYLTYECGVTTDINADWNYRYWCEEKGRCAEIERPYVIGEALFMANGSGRMTHVGWVCGFDKDGEPLVVEARGIVYGVVITRLDGRNWSHRGLMRKRFDYSEESEKMEKVIFEVTSPMQTGMAYSKMQDALNAAGYTDADGNALEVDGKWGRKSQQAFDALIADYTPAAKPEPEPLATFYASDGRYRLTLEYK